MTEIRMIKWKLGDSYCGTALEAINFALDTLSSYHEKILFLQSWREGDLREWPDFEFAPNPKEKK